MVCNFILEAMGGMVSLRFVCIGSGLTFTLLSFPQLHKPTTDFLRTGPCMRTPIPCYNCLHDPHLRYYFHQKDRHHKLREGNFITDENEVHDLDNEGYDLVHRTITAS